MVEIEEPAIVRYYCPHAFSNSMAANVHGGGIGVNHLFAHDIGGIDRLRLARLRFDRLARLLRQCQRSRRIWDRNFNERTHALNVTGAPLGKCEANSIAKPFLTNVSCRLLISNGRRNTALKLVREAVDDIEF